MFKDFICEKIEGDGATLFVRRAGPRNAPSIVLLHGYPHSRCLWITMKKDYRWCIAGTCTPNKQSCAITFDIFTNKILKH